MRIVIFIILIINLTWVPLQVCVPAGCFPTNEYGFILFTKSGYQIYLIKLLIQTSIIGLLLAATYTKSYQKLIDNFKK